MKLTTVAKSDSLPPLGFHLTMRLAEDRVLARGAPSLRLYARLLLRHGRTRGLLAFAVADTHIHVVLEGNRAVAGEFAQVFQTAVQRQMGHGVPFDRARYKAVRDVWHLGNAVRYVVQQEARHGLSDRLHDGTVAPDVLGLRCVDPAIGPRVSSALPRLRDADWAEWAGWRGWEDAPMPVELLADAAAAAIGRGDLRGRDALRRAACIAASHVASAAGLSLERTAQMLEMSTRTVQRALAQPPAPAMRRAIEGQLRVRGRVGMGGAERASPTAPP